MPLGKRELARIERRLITTLTEACETAKGEIEGFTWLTCVFRPIVTARFGTS